MPTRAMLALVLLTLSAPAWAQATRVPEPGDAALFALAVVGLFIGRHTSRRPPRA